MTDAQLSATVAIPDYLQTLLEQIADREGFTDYTIVSQPGSNVGDGFQGLMLSVVIAGTRNATADKLVLICKVPPLSELRRKLGVPAFTKEIYAYDQILPEIVKYQREKEIVDSEGFFAFPKCYGTYANEEQLEFAIVLEDLRHTGYRMWNKYKSIDFNHVRLAVTELGKFHAISFALREQKPEIFEQFQQLEASFLKSAEQFPQFLDFIDKAFDQTLGVLQEEDTAERKMVHAFKENILKRLTNASSGTLAEPFAVLCHGDFWNNNVMFHYANDETLVPDRICLIDWQMVQYCSPATDLGYYLYTSTEQTVRSAHFDDIIGAYHDSLAAQLQRLDGDARKQFSAADFSDQLKRFSVYGVLMAPMLVQMITTAASDLPDMDQLTLENMDTFAMVPNADAYAVRIRDVMRDFVARGYFGDVHLV